MEMAGDLEWEYIRGLISPHHLLDLSSSFLIRGCFPHQPVTASCPWYARLAVQPLQYLVVVRLAPSSKVVEVRSDLKCSSKMTENRNVKSFKFSQVPFSKTRLASAG